MSRKKTTFAWTRDAPPDSPDPEPDEAEEDDDLRDESGRLDRAAHRARMQERKDLAVRLAALPESVRNALPLEQETLESLDRLAHADRTPARRRLVMRARLLLGGEDLDQLEAALAGNTPTAARERALLGWRTRLLAGDDAVLQTFLAEFPQANRQELRTCVREARGADEGARRANKALLRMLRAAMIAALQAAEG